MGAKINIVVNGKKLEVEPGITILDACRQNGIYIPTLCNFKGLTDVGACRLCLVEVEGVSKLMPACTTKVEVDKVVYTDTEKLKKYRRYILELFFSERNHVCAVCVSNGDCELQSLAHIVGMERFHFPYLQQACQLDASHPYFVLDHNRCIMCTRCVRICDEIEEAHNWDVMETGYQVRIISDFAQPWGESETCTSCGKCVEICPTGALWPKSAVQGQRNRKPEKVIGLIKAKEAKR